MGKVQDTKNMLTKGKNGVEGEITQHSLERLILHFLLACYCAPEQLVPIQVLDESSEEINLFKMAEAFSVNKDPSALSVSPSGYRELNCIFSKDKGLS